MAKSRKREGVSIGQQKSFIIENASILNRETKLAILSIVMMEIGSSVVKETGARATSTSTSTPSPRRTKRCWPTFST